MHILAFHINDETSETVKEFSSKFNYHLRELDLDFVAEKLDNGDVFGRFDINSMEFGARALGNRSIIADPRNSQIIHTINKFVKMRDFWMPFAPSILEERVKDYLIIKDSIDARFMAVGFDSTDLGKQHLSAGPPSFRSLSSTSNSKQKV